MSLTNPYRPIETLQKVNVILIDTILFSFIFKL